MRTICARKAAQKLKMSAACRPGRGGRTFCGDDRGGSDDQLGVKVARLVCLDERKLSSNVDRRDARALHGQRVPASARPSDWIGTTFVAVDAKHRPSGEQGERWTERARRERGIRREGALVPRHRGFDWLGATENGQVLGARSTSMLRATRGWRRMWPRRSSVRTIWCTEGGLSWKWRARH